MIIYCKSNPFLRASICSRLSLSRSKAS